MATTKVCAVDGCGKPKHGYIYCGKHYAKWKAYGDPLAGRSGPSPGEPLRWIAEHAAYQGDHCLQWPYERSRYGYGTVKHGGKKRVASRVMCELAHGLPPSDGYDAAHSCGNGHHGCMNPRHLSWKTRKENCVDTAEHGRAYRGERHGWAKLTEAEAREILRLGGTMKQEEIAQRFGVQGSLVSRILAGKRWGWLSG